VKRLTGAYSLAMIFKGEEGLLIGARMGSPLAVGYGEKEAYLGSDAFALAPFTNRVSYLDDGDVAVVRGWAYEDDASDPIAAAQAAFMIMGAPTPPGA
jgi:glucosamine--fructose-6-phosphate aminotransferase (isomerizing)